MISLIPAPHERKFGQLVAEYLLKEGCVHLGLEFPQEVEARLNDYARGKISYDKLVAFLIGGEVISPHFEPGFRPLLQVLPELYKRDKNFGAHCYEDLDLYNDWVLCRDDLTLALLRDEDWDLIAGIYRELVSETRRRNVAIAERLGALVSALGDLHVVMGRLHAPDVASRLEKKFALKTVIIEDICLTPLDESLILCLKGLDLEDAEIFEFLRRHRELALEAERKVREITDLLRDDEIRKRFQLKRYSEIAAIG
ncbi:MAG: hypothetical protein ACP5PX_06130 [Candidatus Hadarchaeum sp.]|uniref:hypothetical protein n=1 Tax=Candidatus Hadarchaeum sp. TaxID=2883567 RepID=UPI003D0D6EF4